MLQALAALLGAVSTIAACYAAGALLMDSIQAPLKKPYLRQNERIPLAFVLGASVLHLIVFAILTLHIAYKPVFIVLLALTIGAAIWKGSWGLRGEKFEPLSRWLKLLYGLIFALFSVLYFFHAWAPESSPDGSGYHLGLVARYLRAHGFEHITTNMYASFSAGAEMLFVPAFAIGRHSAAALVHYAFFLALAWAVLSYGRRIGKPWAGAAGSLLVYLSPVAGIDGTSAYNDLAVAAIVFSVFYWLEIWDEHKDERLLVPVGLLAGYCYAAKYTAFLMLLYALGFVAWRSRRLKPVLMTGALAALMMVPWIAKNWIWAQNPVAPFFSRVFRNPYYSIMAEQQYNDYLSRYEVENKWTLPLEVTLRGEKTTGLIGPVFLLAPLALLSLRFRAGRRLLFAGVLLLATYPFNVGTRFLIPCLPFFSLAMALPFSNLPGVLATVMLFHAWASWPSNIGEYGGKYSWHLDRILYKQALRRGRLTEDKYLSQNFWGYGIARMVDATVPPGSRVFALNGIPDAYTSRDVIVGFQGAINETFRDIFNTGWEESAQPLRHLTFQFPARAMQSIRVFQTGRGAPEEQWNVHELRYFHAGMELPRRPEWRLHAWPNPWDVQFAFDNCPATRWRSKEVAWPGMFIEANFGRLETVDEVTIDTSFDYLNIRLEVQALDEHGQWVKIADQPKEETIEAPPDLRREASRELHLRGIDYLLLNDSDWGASDVREDLESWGLKEIAHGYGARIYKVVVQ